VEWQFFWALIRLLIFLPLVLGLAYFATRYVASWRSAASGSAGSGAALTSRWSSIWPWGRGPVFM
jgi:hypothetical protein